MYNKVELCGVNTGQLPVLTEAEKRDLAMKYEVAEELGLLEKVERYGWRGLTSRESGRIGGIMGTRKTAERKRTEADKVDRVDT